MKDLIGRKVKGFKFDGDRYYETGYIQSMDNYIGVIGKIVESDYITESSVLVDFGDHSWCYPAKLIEQHLID